MTETEVKLLLCDFVEYVYRFKNVADFWTILEEFKKIRKR